MDLSDVMHRKQIRNLRLAVTGLSAIYGIALGCLAAVRPLDGDEGLYSTAARLVWEGKAPYKDFFYQQAPLLPYLYSWIWGVHPHSLVAMRMLSVFCGFAATLIWGLWIISFSDRVGSRIALATFFGIILNPYWFWWNVVIKTYPIANLLMTIATLCLCQAFISGRSRWYFAVGAAFGACTSVRLFYSLLLPAVLVWALLNWQRLGRPVRRILFCLGGWACGLLPMIASFARGPGAFVFNNLKYHRADVGYLELADGTLVHGYQSVGHTLLVYFATIFIRLIGMHPYFTIELAIVIVGWLSFRKHRQSALAVYSEQQLLYFEVAGVLLVVYAVTALSHFPTYDQYLDGPLVPFLVPFLLEGIRATLLRDRKRALTFALALAAPLLMGAEVGRDPWLLGTPSLWRLDSYRQVSEVIAGNTRPGEVVLSFWPGFVFESGRKYFPGLENDYALRLMEKQPPNLRAEYHLTSYQQIMRAIGTQETTVVVIHPRIYEYFETISPSQVQAFHATVDANYTRIGNIDGIGIYKASRSLGVNNGSR